MAEIKKYNYDLLNLEPEDVEFFSQLGIEVKNGLPLHAETGEPVRLGDSFETFETGREIVVLRAHKGSLVLFVSTLQNLLASNISFKHEKIAMVPDVAEYRLPEFEINLFTSFGLHSFPPMYEPQLKQVGIQSRHLSLTHKKGNTHIEVSLSEDVQVHVFRNQSKEIERFDNQQSFELHAGDMLATRGFTFSLKHDRETGKCVLKHLDTDFRSLE